MTIETVRARRWRGGDIALLIVSAVLALLLIVVITVTVGIAVATATASQNRIGQTLSPEELIEGDCVAQFGRAGGTLGEYTLVDCADPHAAELVYIAEFGNDFDIYLGTDASLTLATSICEATLRYKLHLKPIPEKYPDAFLFGVYQSRANWEVGKTQFQCFLVNRDGQPLEGQYYKPDNFG